MFTEDKNQNPSSSYILNNKNSFFEHVGGEHALATISMLFHIHIKNDEMLRNYFAATEMLTQISQQRNFICHVLNGPNSLQGENPLLAFRPIMSNRIAFTTMASYLKQSLHELEYDEMLIEEIMENLNQIQDATLHCEISSG